jgi:hypothetical protein
MRDIIKFRVHQLRGACRVSAPGKGCAQFRVVTEVPFAYARNDIPSRPTSRLLKKSWP